MVVFNAAALLVFVPAALAQGLYKYTGVTGFFDQDNTATDPTTYDFKVHNFGLISQEYPSDTTAPTGSTDWERFANYVASLNEAAPVGTSYKVIVQARHSNAVHNEAQTFYTAADWTCYWSTQDGNGTVTWADGLLTESGEADTQALNSFWLSQVSTAKQPVPQSFYVSPLIRSLDTVNQTFAGVASTSFQPIIKEGLREIVDQQTQDRRSNKAVISERYPSWTIETDFAEMDPLFSTTTSETTAALDVRTQTALDDIFGGDANTFLSITAHTGTLSSWRRVFGLNPFALKPGGAFVTLVKAEEQSLSISSPAWIAHAKCSATPASIVNSECVCPQ